MVLCIEKKVSVFLGDFVVDVEWEMRDTVIKTIQGQLVSIFHLSGVSGGSGVPQIIQHFGGHVGYGKRVQKECQHGRGVQRYLMRSLTTIKHSARELSKKRWNSSVMSLCNVWRRLATEQTTHPHAPGLLLSKRRRRQKTGVRIRSKDPALSYKALLRSSERICWNCSASAPPLLCKSV